MLRRLLLSLLPCALVAQTPFLLRPNDRVVFFGDSITDQRLYTTFAETYVLTRFPKRNISFVHSGWGGDRVSGGGGGPIDVRLYRDVFAYDPTVVTIMLGMNDGRYRAFDQAIFDEYSTGYRHIIASLKRRLPQVRPTVIIPSPYDDVTRAPLFEGGYNKVLRRYGDFLKELAASESLHLADLNTSVVAALEKANSLSAAEAAKMIPDRVHPGPSGHLLMAKALLESWNAPALVSEVEIDAAKKAITSEKNARVSDLRGAGKSLAWTQIDESLPMPIDLKDPLVALAVKSSGFMAALNQQMLKLSKLGAGRYTLKIDGQEVGSFSAEELAAGVNLAELATPMMTQAAAVHALTLQRTGIHNTRWRQVQIPLERFSQPEVLEALAALDELEETLLAEQRKRAQPMAHLFEIAPLP